MQRMVAVAVLLGLLVMATGCGGGPGAEDAEEPGSAPTPTSTPATAADLKRNSWQLDTLMDGSEETDAPAGNAAISFGKAGTLGVKTYCNVGGGSVKVGDGTMKIGPLITTMRACSDTARNEADTFMLRVLEGKVTIEISEKRLIIRKGSRGLGFTAD